MLQTKSNNWWTASACCQADHTQSILHLCPRERTVVTTLLTKPVSLWLALETMSLCSQENKHNPVLPQISEPKVCSQTTMAWPQMNDKEGKERKQASKTLVKSRSHISQFLRCYNYVDAYTYTHTYIIFCISPLSVGTWGKQEVGSESLHEHRAQQEPDELSCKQKVAFIAMASSSWKLIWKFLKRFICKRKCEVTERELWLSERQQVQSATAITSISQS